MTWVNAPIFKCDMCGEESLPKTWLRCGISTLPEGWTGSKSKEGPCHCATCTARIIKEGGRV